MALLLAVGCVAAAKDVGKVNDCRREAGQRGAVATPWGSVE